MQKEYSRIAGVCPLFESVRSARGIEMGLVHSRDLAPRCDHCAYWSGGACGLFLARARN